MKRRGFFTRALTALGFAAGASIPSEAKALPAKDDLSRDELDAVRDLLARRTVRERIEPMRPATDEDGGVTFSASPGIEGLTANGMPLLSLRPSEVPIERYEMLDNPRKFATIHLNGLMLSSATDKNCSNGDYFVEGRTIHFSDRLFRRGDLCWVEYESGKALAPSLDSLRSDR